MALASCMLPKLIVDSSLEGWEVIGSGGFGQIYKARHRQLCCDVAIKLLHYDDGSSNSLLREVDMMRQGSSPYVIHVLGVFKGRLPCSSSVQLGLVMEVMERGSLASLQETLRGTPPWPLVFRLSHQVALGINFLHNLSPALLHLDLKPSNVLLDSWLNAKLTDFGLARFCQSKSSKMNSEGEGGTIGYMPPEAFDLSYSPTRASDIYSYGILLWSIVTGNQPYANALPTMVRFRIPQGDRPSLEEIRQQAAGRAGLTRLMELMEKCWQARPAQRPESLECTAVTEDLYKMHKHAILDAVHEVLKKLEQREEEQVTEQFQRVHVTQTSGSIRNGGVNVYDKVHTGGPPVQEMAGGCSANLRAKARGRGSPSPRPASMTDVEMGRVPIAHTLKVSSVLPILSLPRFPPSTRQVSTPDTMPSNPPPSYVNFHMSDVFGVQVGNNNNMVLDRKRHPTAPPRVNLSPQH